MFSQNRVRAQTPLDSINLALRGLFGNLARPNPFYTYAAVPTTMATLPSIYSKAKPLTITGFGIFNTHVGTLSYLPPFTGPYGQFTTGLGMCCNDYGFKTNPNTSQENLIINPQYTLLPNPSHGVLQLVIDYNTAHTLQYVVTDVLGKEVLENQINHLAEMPKVTVPIILPEHLQQGIYFLKINHQNNQQTFKIQLL